MQCMPFQLVMMIRKQLQDQYFYAIPTVRRIAKNGDKSFLNVNQVRDINDILDSGKIFAQQVVVGDRVGHTFSFGNSKPME